MVTNGNAGGSRGDMKITGSGSSNGGVFNQVKIMGDAVIHGNTDCETFKCLGNAEVKGSLYAGSASCNGAMKVSDAMKGGTVKVHGEMRVASEFAVGAVNISGELGVGGRMSAEKVKIMGEMRVNADCQMEELQVKGTVEVNGMLNAERVDIKLYGPSRLRELVGGQIIVKKSMGLPPLLGKFMPGSEGSLTAESIEGDIVVLENTKAAVVRGRNVTIGPGCRIGFVEYKDEFKQDSGASVSQSAKIGP